MSSENNLNIEELQLIEQNLQNLLLQKQNFQTQLLENEKAMEELKPGSVVYKIVGNLMIKSDAEDIKKDLKSKDEMLNIRIKNIEKQEEILKEKAMKKQSNVLSQISKERSKK
ncbi:prefoldin subunit [Candidatus Woesearchaeota archaeon]|nr:hypothetical protein [uncultured archaeon]MBS3167260.1 prefoldin subunit [Candidatus Woesearchaeota archaeon]